MEVQPLSRIQRISGARLQASWINVPHVTQHEDADITDLDIARVALKAKAEQEGVRLTPLAFIVKACIVALKEFPRFNASLDASGKNLVFKKYFHIGFAADTPNGLVVPVIRDADRGNLFDIARALAALSEKARAGKLTARRDAGRLVHDLESGRHRRHGLHAHHQCAGGRHPGRVASRARSRCSTRARSFRG